MGKRFDHQMMIYSHLKCIFYKHHPTLFDNADLNTNDFATNSFTDLHNIYKPDGYIDAEGKIKEKEEAFKIFEGQPMPYFERLIKLATDCITLGQPAETLCDCIKASDVIFNVATREDASKFDKTWKDWLLMHKKVMKRAVPQQADSWIGQAPTLMHMQPLHPWWWYSTLYPLVTAKSVGVSAVSTVRFWPKLLSRLRW
eukprot:1245156-Rhodomonas_salina.2